MGFGIRVKRGVVFGLFCAAGLFSAQAMAGDNPKEIVRYRHTVMSGIGRNMKAMATIVKGKVSFVGHVRHEAAAINELSQIVLDLFPPETAPGKVETDAKAEIWKNWDDFKAKAEALKTESAKLVEVSQKGDLSLIKAQFGKVGKTCGGCHERYREEED